MNFNIFKDNPALIFILIMLAVGVGIIAIISFFRNR